MQLKRLYMCNFLGVGAEPIEIIFPSSYGITHIRGVNLDVSSLNGDSKTDVPSNGAGKSTMIEGIVFGLTGRTLRNLSLDEMLHNGVKEQGIVEIEYDNIKIIRKIKPNDVELWVDGVNKTINSSKVKTKKLIEDTVGINFDTLANILVFGQHNMFSFLEAGEPEKREIVEDLLNLKEYNLYEEKARTMLRELKATLKTLADQHSITLTHHVSQEKLLQEQETALDEYLKQIKAEMERMEKEHASLPDEVAIRKQWAEYDDVAEKKALFTKAVLDAKSEYNELSSKLNELLHKVRNEQTKKQPLAEKLQAISSKFVKLDEMRRSKMLELDGITANAKVVTERREKVQKEMQSKIDEIKPTQDWEHLIKVGKQRLTDAQEEIDKIARKKGEICDEVTCPTCYGTVDLANIASVIRKWEYEIEIQSHYLEKLKFQASEDKESVKAQQNKIKEDYSVVLSNIDAEIDMLRVQYKEMHSGLESEYREAKEKLEKMKSAAEKKLKDFDQNLKDKYSTLVTSLEDSRNNAQSKVREAETKLSSLKEAPTPSYSLSALAEIEAKKAELAKSIWMRRTALTDQSNPYSDIIVKLKASVAVIAKKAEDIHAQIMENEELLPYYDWWVSAMGKEGIKSFIISQIIPTLNEQLDYWMQVIYQGAISIKFDRLLNVEMRNNASGNQMIFGQGSGGERKRVDIAIMLAFRQIMKMSTGKDPNLLFFDEVAESLDGDGVYRLHKTLEDIARTTRLFVITHNHYLSSLLDRSDRMTFTKKGGHVILEQ